MLEEPSAVVGLLCKSTLEFVLTWSGLIHLGHSVMLLAYVKRDRNWLCRIITLYSPQLDARAIKHLCDELEINTIITDSIDIKKLKSDTNRMIVPVPAYPKTLSSGVPSRAIKTASTVVPFLFHTSGTSSGKPKPIPQSNAVIQCLPRFEENNTTATFTTTPLYHGGLADCLRAWTSGAMIWFFPESELPITGANVIRSIKAAQNQNLAPVGYFSSVPYVLQMLLDEPDGITHLQNMELVGVGGAEMPVAAGDALIKHGVKLLSRFGSAECGFIMSSHRNYDEDKRWNYLQYKCIRNQLLMEPREDGLYELIVGSNWPCLLKTNRNDGSFATSDLFETHADHPNKWHYKGRSDANIALANGKKIDPSSIEAAVMSASATIKEAYVFGSGRPSLGVILYHSSDFANDDFLEAVWPLLDEVNARNPSLSRIARSMVIVLRSDDPDLLPRTSSKGTKLRRQTDEKLLSFIEDVYKKDYLPQLAQSFTPIEDSTSIVQGCIEQVVGYSVHPDKDLYQQGIDSLACIQIRKSLQESIGTKDGLPLPINVVYDQGTVLRLAAFLSGVKEEHNGPNVLKSIATKMREYSNTYKVQIESPGAKKLGKELFIVLTGTTGFLGAYILNALRSFPDVVKIYCPVRASTPLEARSRINREIQTHGWAALDDESNSPRIHYVPFGMRNDALVLADEYRGEILRDSTHFIHAAWAVNFNVKLDSFADQLAGTRDLIELSASAGAKFTFVSSTAAVSSSKCVSISETVSEHPSDSSPLGYSQSKWVMENIISEANHNIYDTKADLEPIEIIRVGQLCGDESGAWNLREAYPLLLSTAGIVGGLPSLKGQVLDWMPVHLAAQAILDIALPRSQDQGPRGLENISEKVSLLTPVYHVLNNKNTPKWEQMLCWILEDSHWSSLDVFSPIMWLEKLQDIKTEHPAHSLLDLWKSMVSKDASQRAIFDVSSTQRASKTMRQIQPLTEESVLKMVRWVLETSTQSAKGSFATTLAK